jgi:DNA-binding IclR family transcriptional regulator
MEQYVSSLENAFAILALLEPKRPVLRVGEVCRELGMPKSSVSRLMKTMGEFGLLEREQADQGYVVGRRALELTDLYLSRHTLLDLIDLTIDRIVREFGFAGYASILSGRDLLVLRVKHGSYPLRLVQQVGKRIPSYDTAIGRALLSRMNEDEALRMAASDLPLDQRSLRRELDRVRQIGIAASISTTIPGIGAIGAAVRSADGSEAIGFSVSFPISASDTALRLKMARWIRDEAATIAARIGDAYWVGRTTSPLETAELESVFDATPPANSSIAAATPTLGRST